MTTHRTEAEKLLKDIREQGDPYEPYTRSEMALMAIGHALLALGSQTSIEIQAPNYVSDIRCGYRTPTGYRCVLMKPHTGIPHRTEAGQASE